MNFLLKEKFPLSFTIFQTTKQKSQDILNMPPETVLICFIFVLMWLQHSFHQTPRPQIVPFICLFVLNLVIPGLETLVILLTAKNLGDLLVITNALILILFAMGLEEMAKRYLGIFPHIRSLSSKASDAYFTCSADENLLLKLTVSQDQIDLQDQMDLQDQIEPI